ncbi:MAG: hypothetical protein ABIE25_03870 [Thermoplasmatota archaeon]|nr:hypothetical protein [Candidatus Thermoplasmatota archaeon]MBU1914608.1 hypothetical protein [Candidatus Thermoplasmatota archaeon]
MRCTVCGTDNDAAQVRCGKCGQMLTHLRSRVAGPGNGIASGVSNHSASEVARKYKNEYSHVSIDQTDRSIEMIQDLLEMISTQKVDSKALCEHIVKTVYRQMHVKEVSVGLRSASDGKFRYVTMHGMRANVWTEHKKLAYTNDEFSDSAIYKGTMISKYTKLFLAEDEPYHESEKGTFNEHLMQISMRKAIDDSIEGDYLDIHVFGQGNELLGWIEISGTWENKLLGPRSLKTMEIMASLAGIAFARDPTIVGQTP